MVWEINDGRGGVTHTSDFDRAVLETLDGDGPDLDNPIDAMLHRLGASVANAFTKHREIATEREGDKNEAYNNAHRSIIATLDLIATDEGQSLRTTIDPSEAVASFLRLSGALADGVSKGVILDNMPTTTLIETLDSAISTLLNMSTESTQPDDDFDFETTMAEVTQSLMRETCSRVLEEIKRWIESDSMVRTMGLTF